MAFRLTFEVPTEDRIDTEGVFAHPHKLRIGYPPHRCDIYHTWHQYVKAWFRSCDWVIVSVWMVDEEWAALEGVERLWVECGGGASPFSGLSISDRRVLAGAGRPMTVWQYHWNLCWLYGLLPMVWLTAIP